ncbi:hypothetical protein [Janthinobacterium sp. J1-1]|uniref:hypothetical protein n=1 Tax=Janthinobacterium sp. J1-1 TaxID=3065910 RepID=UPI0028110398|nr:hypothetical protein [Janthinobacterium sp. J1-1]
MRSFPVLIAAAALAALAYACWPAPAPVTPAVLTPASAGRSLSSYFNLDASQAPVLVATSAAPGLEQQLARLAASGSPDDAYAAYNLLDDCIMFQKEGRLPALEFERGSEMTADEKSAQKHLCANLTERQKSARLDFLEKAAKGGVAGASTRFFYEGPFGDRSALRSRPDDPLVLAWKQQAVAQLTVQADQAELSSLGTLMMAYLTDGDVTKKDAPKAYGYLLALRMVHDDILTPGSTNPYQDSYWHWLRDELTPEQQAAAVSRANAIAAKFRQHAGLPALG